MSHDPGKWKSNDGGGCFEVIGGIIFWIIMLSVISAIFN